MSQPLACLDLPHGSVALPAFLPDATLGVVRSLDARDLLACDVPALVMNTFHLMQRPGSSTVRSLGGLHRMSGWPRPIVTDSGGFQAYSLIHQNPRYGSLSEKGILFRPEGSARRVLLTPEKTIQLQVSYGADIVICLDDCTHVDAPDADQESAVRRTVAWARRCKRELARLVEAAPPGRARPLLFAVIQGGGSRELRRRCAEELLEIGFDGFGYGGWPLDAQGQLLTDLIAYTRSLVPAPLPMHALGIGHPINLVACAEMGYSLFDSALPTRDARRGRLYTLTLDAAAPPRSGALGAWFAPVYVDDQKHIKADVPISTTCDCLCCAQYTLGYLHHLFKIGDSAFLRLATLHNLQTMVRLTRALRGSAHA